MIDLSSAEKNICMSLSNLSDCSWLIFLNLLALNILLDCVKQTDHRLIEVFLHKPKPHSDLCHYSTESEECKLSLINKL